MNKADKIKRREGILYKIVKQIPSDNDKWYVKYNRDSDTYYIEKEGKKNYCYSDDEQSKKRRMRKRKNKESIDEISQGLLIKQKKQKKLQQKNHKLFFQKQKKNKR